MNPIYDNHCSHRTILSIQQPDYRKDIRILFGTPSSNGRDLIGLKGYANLVEAGSKDKIEEEEEEPKSHVVKKDLSRQEEILHRWKEMDDIIVGIVNHPHEYPNKNIQSKPKIQENSTDLTSPSSSDDDDDEIPTWMEGKRYHKIHRSPINSHVWAVLVLEDDNNDGGKMKAQSSYTVSHKLLIPADEI